LRVTGSVRNNQAACNKYFFHLFFLQMKKTGNGWRNLFNQLQYLFSGLPYFPY